MAQQIINLGTLADGSDGDTNKVAWNKAKDNFAELYGRMVGKGYISGFQMKWVSGTALTLTSGAAYIEGTGSVLFSDSDIAKTGLSLAANTWYHVYPYDNAGTPDFVLSTTAPATAYNGTARSMTGDSSKRYAGSVKTDASGNIYNFSIVAGNLLRYASAGNAGAAPFRILSAGVATSITDVDVSGAIPATATTGYFRFQVNGGTYSYLYPGGATDVADLDLVAAYSSSATFGATFGPCRLGNGIKVAYAAANSSSATYIFVLGYYIER